MKISDQHRTGAALCALIVVATLAAKAMPAFAFGQLQDFSISANPSSLTLGQGGLGNSTISTTTLGNPQGISMSASGLPTGASSSFSANPITSGQSSTLTIVTSSSTPTGSYSVKVTGVGASNGATHSTTITLAVVPNDFSISASPSSLTLGQGVAGSSNIATTTTSGEAQSITLSASGLPGGASPSFSANPITSGQSSTLAISTLSSTPTGTYSVTVIGTGSFATHSTTITLTVVPNDFSIAVSPTSLTVDQGAVGSTSIMTTTTSGAAQSIGLSMSGLPAGTSAAFSANPITSGQRSTVLISTSGATPSGSYAVTVTGTGTYATHNTTLTLTVVQNDFSISVSPGHVSISQGRSGSATVSTVISSGASQNMNLSASGLPTGASATMSPNPISSSQSSTLTITTASTTPAGTYPVTITGTGAYTTHSTTLTLVVVLVPSNACADGTALADGYIADSYLRIREMQSDSQTVALCVRYQNTDLNVAEGGLVSIQLPSRYSPNLPTVDDSSSACGGTVGDDDTLLADSTVGPIDPSSPESQVTLILEKAQDPQTGATWVCLSLVEPAGGPSPGLTLGKRVVVPMPSPAPTVVTFAQDPAGAFPAAVPPWPVAGPPSSQCQQNPGSTELVAMSSATGGIWLDTMQPNAGSVDVCVRVQDGSGGEGGILALNGSQLPSPNQLISAGNAAGGTSTCPDRVITSSTPVQLSVWRSATGATPATICIQVDNGPWTSLTAGGGVSNTPLTWTPDPQ